MDDKTNQLFEDKIKYLSAETKKVVYKSISYAEQATVKFILTSSLDDIEAYFNNEVIVASINRNYKASAANLKSDNNLQRKKKQARPRDKNPAPREFEQYSNMSTYFVRNTRLTMGARNCLTLINAFCGRNNHTQVTAQSLASELGVTRRTVQRYLQELRDNNAIRTIRAFNSIGMVIGIKIILCELVKSAFSKTTFNKILEKARNQANEGMIPITDAFNFAKNSAKMTHININTFLKKMPEWQNSPRYKKLQTKK